MKCLNKRENKRTSTAFDVIQKIQRNARREILRTSNVLTLIKFIHIDSLSPGISEANVSVWMNREMRWQWQ